MNGIVSEQLHTVASVHIATSELTFGHFAVPKLFSSIWLVHFSLVVAMCTGLNSLSNLQDPLL